MIPRFRSSKVQRFRDSKLQKFLVYSEVRRFASSVIQSFRGSEIRRFRGSKSCRKVDGLQIPPLPRKTAAEQRKMVARTRPSVEKFISLLEICTALRREHRKCRNRSLRIFGKKVPKSRWPPSTAPATKKKPSSKKKIVKKRLLFEKCTASQREYQNHRNLTGEKSELARR